MTTIGTRGLGALILAASLTGSGGSLAAQQRITVFASAGAADALRPLKVYPVAKFKDGPVVDLCVGYRLNPHLSVRAAADWGRQEFRDANTSLQVPVDEFFYGIDLMDRAVGGNPTLYGFAGGGIERLHQQGTSGLDRSLAAGRLGTGVSYALARTPVELFAQATGWTYKVKGFKSPSALAGYDRGEFDVSLTGGMQLRL